MASHPEEEPTADFIHESYSEDEEEDSDMEFECASTADPAEHQGGDEDDENDNEDEYSMGEGGNEAEIGEDDGLGKNNEEEYAFPGSLSNEEGNGADKEDNGIKAYVRPPTARLDTLNYSNKFQAKAHSDAIFVNNDSESNKNKIKTKQPVSLNYDTIDDDNSEDDGNDDLSKEEDRFYAVRKGKSTTACIFLYWEDCWEQIGGFEEAEYEGFVSIEAAIEYVRFAKLEEKASAKKQKRKKREDSSGANVEKEKSQKRGRGRPNNEQKTDCKKAKIDTKASLRWNQMYEELVRYKEEYGDCLVPTACSKSPNVELSRWVTAQRRYYKDLQNGKSSPMTRDRFDKLTEVGFAFKLCEIKREKMAKLKEATSFTTQKDRKDRKYLTWEMRFEDLKKYKEEHGTCDVRLGYGSLGRWVRSMRYQMKHFKEGKPVSTLTAERVALLENLGFVMDLKEARAGENKPPRKLYERKNPSGPGWEEMYEQLRQYWLKHGTSLVKCSPYTPLRGWMVRQREQYMLLREGRPSTMTAERMQRLNDIDFPFLSTQKNLTWEERYEQLKQYKAEFGNIMVSRYSTEFVGLGKWVQQQRGKYKLKMEGKYSNLTDERIRLLEELGMVWSVLRKCKDRAERMPWSARFEQLLQFKKERGHTVVPQHYPELGNWVHQQRVHYKLMKRGKESLMTPQKALKLADVGFVFEVKGRKPKAAIEEQEVQNNPTRVSWNSSGLNNGQFLPQDIRNNGQFLSQDFNL